MNRENFTPTLRALGFIVLGGSILSFTPVFVNLANVGPSVSAFYRMFFGGIILIAVTLLRREQLWYDFKSLMIPFICAFFFTIDLFFWHRSILFVGPGLATILGNMQVFFIAIFAVTFLKEKLNWKLLISIPLAISGLFLMVHTNWGQQDGNFQMGVIYGLITALFFAGYILMLRKSQDVENQQRYSSFANMAWISLFAAGMLGFTVFLEPEATFMIPDVQSWWALIGLGVAGQVLGWVLISKGLPRLDAAIGGLVILLEPALSFTWDILFFNRPTSLLDYAGAAIMLIAIYLGSVSSRKKG